MEENNNTASLCFAVDLEKTEYIQFYDLLSRFNGAQRMKRGGCWLVCFLVVSTLLSWVQTDGAAMLQSTDFYLLAGLLVLTVLYMTVGIPLFRRRQAATAFDRAVEAGQIFAGTVTVTEAAITKETPSGTLSLRFSEKLLYLETREMQVFVNTAGRAIVLPGRCLTAEDAAAVRQIAENAIPQPFRRVRETVVARRSERMTLPDEPETVSSLFEIQVHYRAEERQALARELARRIFFSSFPPYAVSAFLFAFLFGMVDGFLVSALVFWGVLVLSLVLLFVSIRRRSRALMENDDFSFTFSITENAITVDGGAQNGRVMLPWERVSHAVEGADAVEFFNRRQYIYIPKRCIEDIEAFRGLVERCRRLKERNG